MSTTEASSAVKNRLVWMDLEVKTLFGCQNQIIAALFQMTGLDDSKDHIMEAACLVTDGDLNIIAEGPNLIINQSDSILDAMGDWCKKTHGEVH